MKSFVCLALLVAVIAAHAAEEPITKGSKTVKSSVECDEKRYAYFDFVQIMFGGPPEHYIVVHEEGANFSGIRLLPPSKLPRPSVPYVALGEIVFPLSQYGVYLLKKEEDRITVEYLAAHLPEKQDQKSIEEFICDILRRPSTEKELADWLKAKRQRK